MAEDKGKDEKNKPDSEKEESESESQRRRKIARRVAIGLLAGSAGLYLGGQAARLLAARRMYTATSGAKDWISFSEAKRRGHLPRHSSLLNVQPVDRKPNRIQRWIRKLVGADKETYGAEGSFALINAPSGLPLFYLGKDPKNHVNERIAQHEGGHWKAQQARKHNADYIYESNEANRRFGGWTDIFHPMRERSRDGKLTMVGLEQEAWNRGGVAANDPLRRAAVGTYATEGAVRSMNRWLKLTSATGVGVGAYSLLPAADDKKPVKKIKDPKYGDAVIVH